ncbi:uncharacterized protein LOC122498867 [Leptopilina heterotoma]|uniref:uncharacterized protein LOC122498867 n=1 Tax=Leptopilina heterotoma TaxID=63436 RepID=UPI001CA8FBEC|nr:uncharacterized protein LOC122498867 [Leptopilina heterotoma]
MSYKLLLCEWGLEKYIEKFEDEEIDDESFPFLEKEKISDLFPKVGPYSKFIRLYNNWIHDKENNEPASTPVNNALQLKSDIEGTYEIGPDGQLEEVYNPQDSNSERNELEDFTLEEEVQNTLKAEKRSANVTTVVPEKRRKVSSDSTHHSIIKEGPIYECLINNIRGNLAIAEYESKGFLRSRTQQIVAECVLSQEFKGDIWKQIHREQFLKLSEGIELLFPSENKETYYIPYYKNEAGKKYSASGKLVDLFYNIRKRAVRSGIQSSRKNSSQKSTDNDALTNAVTPDADTLNKINSLSITCIPWQDCIEKWRDTHDYRMTEIRSTATVTSKTKGGKEKTTISNKVTFYITKYRGIKEALGYTLLELDYSMLYPGTEENLLFLWPSFKSKLLSVFQRDNSNLFKSNSNG